MGRFAEGTTVAPDRSRAEIEKTLERYGATGFGYAAEGDRAMVAFKMGDKQVRFFLRLPDPNDEEFRYTPTRQRRTALQMQTAHHKEVRRLWRALALAIKAKLEAVESGIVSFDDEFLAHFVLPSGETVGERLGPQVNELSSQGLPALMPGSS